MNTVCTSSPEDVKTLLRSEDKRPFRPPSPTVAQGRLDNNLHPGVAMVQGDEWYQVSSTVYEKWLMVSKEFVSVPALQVNANCFYVQYV